MARFDLTFNLDAVEVDPFGRVALLNRTDGAELRLLLQEADAAVCRHGAGGAMGWTTALIREEELLQWGGALVIDNAGFAEILRRMKAVETSPARLAFTTFREAI
jgi:predicted component of type VI protein secretion system